MLNIDDVVLHYRVLELVGRGESGAVYKVVDQQTNEHLAMKMLDWPGTDNPVDLARMRKEAAAVQSLRHPHICGVHAIHEVDQSLCVIMDLLEGASLDLVIGNRPVREGLLLGFARDIASALDAAHGRAILHRDLRPSKMIVTKAGVKVLDFGFGWIIKHARGAQMTGAISLHRVLSYASPEQIRGEPTDPRSDLFSFGSILYEMATGEPPFGGHDMPDVLVKILTAAPTPPRSLNPAVSPTVERIALKALEKERSARYQRASDLIVDLQQISSADANKDPVGAASTQPRVEDLAPHPTPSPSAAGPKTAHRPQPITLGDTTERVDHDAPQLIGRYRVIHRLGVGGLGEVFLAHDPMLDRKVAIKILRRPESYEALSREARSIARLHHPNIVDVFDFGTHDGHPFIAMEYIEGQNLQHLIAGPTRLRLGRKLSLMEQLSAGLAYAHRQGIVHRDIKAANRMGDGNGILKILDFGLAAQATHTESGLVFGTLAYVSPEQLSQRVVDGRSDMFSAGVVFYELLAARRPFVGDSLPQLVQAIIASNPTPLGDLVPGLDPALIALINRCLEKQPDQRFADMDHVQQDLERIRTRLREQDGTLAVATATGAIAAGDLAAAGALLRTAAEGAAALAEQAAREALRQSAEAMRHTGAPARAAVPPAAAAPKSQATSVPAAVETRSAGRTPASRMAQPSASVSPGIREEPETHERTLDLAVPPRAAVRVAMELVALLRLPTSASLQELLAAEGDADLTRGARSRSFGMEFLRDSTGRLKATTVTMRVVAPDFDPPYVEKTVRVRPDADCERQAFLLSPKTPGRLKIQFDLMRGEIALASRAIETTAESAPVENPAPSTIISIPLVIQVTRRVSPPLRQIRALGTWIRTSGPLVWTVGAILLGWMAVEGVRWTQNSRGTPSSGSNATALESRSVQVLPISGLATPTGSSYALLIGINRYASLPSLLTAVNDARAVDTVLRERYGFTTRVLEDASRYSVLSALNDYDTLLKDGDNLLVYYAGHGYYDQEANKAYWLPADAQAKNRANWIIADDITSDIRAIPARHVLLISDSCYSGGLTRDASPVSTPQERGEFLRKMNSYRSRTLLASGGTEPVADGGGSDGHSIFASVLLTGLQQFESPAFAARELFDRYIQVSVAGRSHQVPQYQLIRDSGHDGGDFIFVRKSAPKPGAPGGLPPR